MHLRKKEFHADRAPEARNRMNNDVRWHFSALASAIALLLASFTTPAAYALGLGQMSIQSALGEPLKAEIDILELTPEEAASLKAGIATADAYKAAGLEYTAAVVNVQVTLQKRSDGRSYLSLNSTRPITEPFVDLILEATWSSGRIVRDYTLLFDPPNLRQATNPSKPDVPSPPALTRPEAPPVDLTAGTKGRPVTPDVAPPTRSAPLAKLPEPKVSIAPKVQGTGAQVVVSKGDTAGKIAAQNKSESVSLDQMLVAMLRSNPNAFTAGNINRLKSGSILDIPDANEAGATSVGDASKTIIAQAKDFNEYRRKLADPASLSQADIANRQAAGKIEAKVEDRTPVATTPDKLTLSKGAAKGKTPTEDKIAKDRQAKEVSIRAVELAKNIADLNKLATAPSPSPAQSPAPSPAATANAVKAPGIAVAKPEGLAVPQVAPMAATTASTPQSIAPTAITPAASTGATQSASAPETSTPSLTKLPSAQTIDPASASTSVATATKKLTTEPLPQAEPSLLDELKENTWLIAAFSGLLLLLAGLGFQRHQRRKSLAQIDSSFLESRLQPDSFFGSSGGQRIDTSEDGGTGSSLVYSPSQLDAADDVDPVAEADVYLAYGRDLQAEEILKEAVRTTPRRVAIHAKLLEIYAKRRDMKAFEAVATDAFNLTRGEGPEWAHIRAMGSELDPENTMYGPGGRPPAQKGANSGHEKASDEPEFGSSTISPMIEPQYQPPAASVDFDLDLNFLTADQPLDKSNTNTNPNPTSTAPFMDVASSAQSAPRPTLKSPPKPIVDMVLMDNFDAPSNDVVQHQASVTARPLPTLETIAVPDAGMLEFDLDSLSLDLDSPATKNSGTPLMSVDDPLEIKFALAQEFRAVGDQEGARSLADEVVAQAEGALKNKAQAFLRDLA